MKYPQATPISKEPISATLVPQNFKLQTLPRVFGRHFLSMENHVFQWARRLCSTYDGGDWNYYDLTNGGFYMAPAEQKTWNAAWAMNYFEGDLSSDALGVLVTIQALNTLAFRSQDDLLLGRLYQLQEFIQFHPERVAIIAALD